MVIKQLRTQKKVAACVTTFDAVIFTENIKDSQRGDCHDSPASEWFCLMTVGCHFTTQI